MPRNLPKRKVKRKQNVPEGPARYNPQSEEWIEIYQEAERKKKEKEAAEDEKKKRKEARQSGEKSKPRKTEDKKSKTTSKSSDTDAPQTSNLRRSTRKTAATFQ